MSDKHNDELIQTLYEWATEKLKRPARVDDIGKDGRLYVLSNGEAIPSNLQEICLLLNK